MLVLTEMTEDLSKKPLLYYKRNGRVFYLKNDFIDVKVKLSGIELYRFVDQFNIGDWIICDPTESKTDPFL